MSSEEQIAPHPYNEEYPLTTHLIGGWGGNAFELFGKDNGAVLEKIGVWVGGWQVTAVRAWLSDGRDRTFGEPTGPYKEYTFQPGENFTSLSLWGNGAGTRLGAIKFRTTNGGEFFHCMTQWPLMQEYVIDIGSGLCLGIKGRSGSDIDQMGFVFLNKVESALLTDVDYPTLSSLVPSVQVEEIQSVSYENDSSVEQTHTVETSKKITTTSSWSLSVGVTLTYSAQVQAGIPGLLDVSGGYSFTVSTTTTHQETISEERTETVTTPIVVPPRTQVDMNITIGRAVIDLPYTGRMEITCKNGSVLQYCVKGVYKGVAYTKIKVDTKESPL